MNWIPCLFSLAPLSNSTECKLSPLWNAGSTARTHLIPSLSGTEGAGALSSDRGHVGTGCLHSYLAWCRMSNNLSCSIVLRCVIYFMMVFKSQGQILSSILYICMGRVLKSHLVLDVDVLLCSCGYTCLNLLLCACIISPCLLHCTVSQEM